jgi:DNA-binding IclR family transcriptional regulator
MPLTPSPAVLRAGDLLHHLASRPAQRLTVSELARHVGLPRATCDTLLLALSERGFVRRDAELRYELGPACVVVGDAAREANPALRAAAEHAEALARRESAVTAVSIRDGEETRLTNVFDFGPPVALRARVGEAIQLVPPFGASFVAWDDDAGITRWLDRADPALSASYAARYRAALDAVRGRGFSVTRVTARQPILIDALERLAGDGDVDAARGARDEAVRQMAHSEYLAGELDPEGAVRIAQVSAPVFEPGGRVGASIMLLGPSQEVTADEIAELGARVLAAASAATAAVRGSTGVTGSRRAPSAR